MRPQVTAKFLGTLAATATVAGAFDAKAADAVVADPTVVDTRITLAFEGGALWSNNDGLDKVGINGQDKLGSDGGDIYGAISLSKRYDTDLDWRLSAAYHFGSDSDYDATFSDDEQALDIFADESYDFQTVDFDLGKHVQVARADVRLFGGVRALHFSEDFGLGYTLTDLEDPEDGGAIDKVGSSDFWGIGPRIGAEAYVPVGQTWGFTGSLAGAVIWGKRDTDLDLSVVPNDPGEPGTFLSSSEDSTETVGNVDLTAGVKWNAWEGGAITAGYRVDHFTNLRSLNLSEDDDQDETFHGPFLKVEVKF